MKITLEWTRTVTRRPPGWQARRATAILLLSTYAIALAAFAFAAFAQSPLPTPGQVTVTIIDKATDPATIPGPRCRQINEADFTAPDPAATNIAPDARMLVTGTPGGQFDGLYTIRRVTIGRDAAGKIVEVKALAHCRPEPAAR